VITYNVLEVGDYKPYVCGTGWGLLKELRSGQFLLKVSMADECDKGAFSVYRYSRTTVHTLDTEAFAHHH